MTDKARSIVIVVGSDSDISQCVEGFELLSKAGNEGIVSVFGVETASIHRNTKQVLGILENLDFVDVLITGAGWANHLTGTSDAYLRYVLENKRTVVVGVAFECAEDPDKTETAIRSIKHVPGTQVVYQDEDGEFIGPDGFFRACKFAAYGDLPEIKPATPRNTETRSLREALIFGRAKRK